MMNEQEALALIATNRHEKQVIRQTILTTLDLLAALCRPTDQTVDPDQVVDAERIRWTYEGLEVAYKRLGELEGKEQELYGLVERAVRQQEASKQAFIAGYDARLSDLEAKASGIEYAQLRRLLHTLRTDKQLPF